MKTNQQRAIELLRGCGMSDEEIEQAFSLEEGYLIRSRDEIIASYQSLAIRTESKITKASEEDFRVIHAVLGMMSELSELQASLYKEDTINTLEELGDMLWYVAVCADAMRLSVDSMLGRSCPHMGVDLDGDTFDSLRTQFSMYVHDGMSYLIRQVSELSDQVKKTIFYGKDFDCEKVEGRLIAILFVISTFPCDIHQIMDRNIEKLKARYPEGFTSEKALTRDLELERKVLESPDA